MNVGAVLAIAAIAIGATLRIRAAGSPEELYLSAKIAGAQTHVR